MYIADQGNARVVRRRWNPNLRRDRVAKRLWRWWRTDYCVQNSHLSRDDKSGWVSNDWNITSSYFSVMYKSQLYVSGNSQASGRKPTASRCNFTQTNTWGFMALSHDAARVTFVAACRVNCQDGATSVKYAMTWGRALKRHGGK